MINTLFKLKPFETGALYTGREYVHGPFFTIAHIEFLPRLCCLGVLLSVGGSPSPERQETHLSTYWTQFKLVYPFPG